MKKTFKKGLTYSNKYAIIYTTTENKTTRKKEVHTMKKFTTINTKSFQYDADHKGAHYTFNNGKNYLNAGELKEALLKHAFGLEGKKDANTAFDVASDIEEYHMSVKSSKATLTNEILGKDMESSLNTYFARTASECWAWVILQDEFITAYIMDANEFRTFTETFASYNKEGKIRYKSDSTKMLAWFEARV